MSPKGSQNGAQSGPRDLLGGLTEDNNGFFSGPGGLWERFASLPGKLLEPT